MRCKVWSCKRWKLISHLSCWSMCKWFWNWQIILFIYIYICAVYLITLYNCCDEVGNWKSIIYKNQLINFYWCWNPINWNSLQALMSSILVSVFLWIALTFLNVKSILTRICFLLSFFCCYHMVNCDMMGVS